MSALDTRTRALVTLAAAIASGDEAAITKRVRAAVKAKVPTVWGDELLLQSVLMVGWPRTLVAAGIWRKAVPKPAKASSSDLDYSAHELWLRRGEKTCQLIYGNNYDKLRDNVRPLHPALAAWNSREGSGRTLARPGLDLGRREFCVIAQTAVLDTPHQLQSHLRGAVHAGATIAEISAVLSAVTPFLTARQAMSIAKLWRHIRARPTAHGPRPTAHS